MLIYICFRGASSTLMQDIANRTFNYPDFNEIMPSIYARFMEKEARQWRQIYKALQLLEYLIKNGSERVVDDARSHISTIKMLRNFHYIDEKGKDEGLNVRNRSRELVELLSDVDKIRGERRKAKANKHKYTGTGNDGGMGGMSFASESGGRYGGFGSESLSYGGGGGSGSDYYNSGGGSSSGGGGGGSSGGFRDERRGGGFDEYNAGDDEIGAVNGGRTTSPVNTRAPPVRKSTAPPPPPPPPAAPVNLFDTDDDDFGAPVPAPVSKALPVRAPPAPAAPVGGLLDDDDFDDFQAAPVQAAAPAPAAFGGMVPQAPAPATGLHALLNATPAVAPAFAPQPPRTGTGMMGTPMGMGMGAPVQPGHRFTGSVSSPPLQPQTPNYSGMAPMAPARGMSMGMGMGMGMGGAGTPAPATPSKPAASFDDLWSMSLGGSNAAAKPATPGAGATGTKSIKDLEKEKPAAMGSGMMGGMGGGSSSSGLDDLLG
ncbi:hypothetical protein K438DRAFT_816605 [Mycena galopus ATCC 62051]|nr:hypothetical protein K438DRAFT_816605 [Mycena galopus ATCC 62051]